MASLKQNQSYPQRQAPRKVILLLVMSIGFVFGAINAFVWYGATGLPSLALLQEYQPSLVTRIHADNGKSIGQFYLERRMLIPLNETPKFLINAVIAVEDTRFFKHPGLDLRGIIRAAWTNLKRGGKFEGASTITQQLARSLFLSPERTFRRKIRELILALKIELILTKEQILEMYLNQIYFGHGAYGVGTASLTYFGKNLLEISLPEAALLAGLPKAPSTYSPYKNPELSKKRQEHVLDRMIQAGFITADLGKQAKSDALPFLRQSPERIAPYFLEHVRQHLVNTYGEAMVYKGGLQVFTTLNIEMQKIAEQAIRKGLHDLDKRQGWRGPIGRETLPIVLPNPMDPAHSLIPKPGDLLHGVVTKVSKKEATVVANGLEAPLPLKGMLWARRRLIKNTEVTDAKKFPTHTVEDILKPGDVIEVVVRRGRNGHLRFGLEQTPIVEGALIALDPRTGAVRAMVGGYDFERSEFNRAILAHRQPGSAFKPIIYATAIKHGMTPATLIMDAPVVYKDKETQKVWKPENYEKRFFGLITLREALRHSRNAATVRLLEQIGVRKVINFSKTVGIRSSLSSDLSLALGSSVVNLQELTSAYGVFGNQGILLSPYNISIAKNQKNKTLEQHLFEPRQVVSKHTAYIITNMLMDVIQNGTGRRARFIGKSLAGKTGTTNSYRDAWFVGYSSNLVTGIWVGFDSARTLGKVESGAHAALPIWTRFMAAALKSLPEKTFPIPEGIQFMEIDPTTGVLAREPREETRTEIFTEETLPKKRSGLTTNPLDFYEFDQ